MKAAIWVLAATVLFSACKSKHPSSLNPGKKVRLQTPTLPLRMERKVKRRKVRQILRNQTVLWYYLTSHKL